jgi:hypothetical protein
MQTETLIKLIEELVELKIRQHAAITAVASRSAPNLARVISETHAADHRRLDQLKSELAKVLQAEVPPPAAPAPAEPPRLRMYGA